VRPTLDERGHRITGRVRGERQGADVECRDLIRKVQEMFVQGLVGRAGQMEAVRRFDLGGIDDGKRCRCVNVGGQAGVDASRDERSQEASAQSVARDRTQIADGDAEAREPDCGVERTSPGEQAELVPVQMCVEERFADDRDHATPLPRFAPATSAGGS
jgi:hypothetical protein